MCNKFFATKSLWLIVGENLCGLRDAFSELFAVTGSCVNQPLSIE